MMSFLMLFSVTVHAYIPSTHFVMSKVAESHGQGAYLVEQDVDFSAGGDRFVVHESWIIADGDEMRVQVKSDAMKFVKVYKKGRGYWFDGGSERSQEFSPDFFMPALFTRNTNDLKKLFVRMDILPNDVFREKKLPRDLKDYKPETESFVRLGRVDGAITFAYGEPTPVGAAALPGLWIDQDYFSIRKIRSRSGTEFLGNDYASFSRNLRLPKKQTLTFDGYAVSIRLTKVQSLRLTNEQKKLLDPGLMRGQRVPVEFPSTGARVAVETFYTRMR